MIFAWPWALAAAAALPALAAIYWLRRRARRTPVSSLLLWRRQPPDLAGGRRPERFRPPPIFLLELLILALLAVAAAGPVLPGGELRRPLVAVLDDSFSMLAGGDRSPRERAVAALLDEVEGGRHGAVTLIVAGDRPRRLGDPGAGGETGDLARRLDGWRPSAASARLDDAVALAGELAGAPGRPGSARIVVLTDRPPTEPPEGGRIEWWGFGRPRPNLAIVEAVRGTGAGDADRVLVSVANFAAAASVRLVVREEGGGREERFDLELAAGEVARRRLAVRSGTAVELALESGEGSGAGDPLGIDDRVLLLPERATPVTVEVAVSDETLRRLVRRTLEATGGARFHPGGEGDGGAELRVSDRPAAAGGRGAGGSWTVRIVAGGEPVPYLGPFVFDRGHPLTDGLSLAGVVWAAGEAGAGSAYGVAGRAVVSAGDLPLLVDRSGGGAGGVRELVLAFEPRLSTLQRAPAWPALWWNLLAWRAAARPGIARVNPRLGEAVELRLPAGVAEAVWIDPEGGRRELSAADGRVRVAASAVGVHELRYGGRADRFAVNAVAAGESDLRAAASGRWGSWDAAGVAGRGDRGWRAAWWIPAFLAFGLLALHLGWTGGRRGGDR